MKFLVIPRMFNGYILLSCGHPNLPGGWFHQLLDLCQSNLSSFTGRDLSVPDLAAAAGKTWVLFVIVIELNHIQGW